MKLQSRPEQTRIHAFRLDANDWACFQTLARRQGWQALSALRQLVLQYAASPFDLAPERVSAGEARTGWFECDANAVAALETGAKRAGITFNDAMRQLIAGAIGRSDVSMRKPIHRGQQRIEM